MDCVPRVQVGPPFENHHEERDDHQHGADETIGDDSDGLFDRAANEPQPPSAQSPEHRAHDTTPTVSHVLLPGATPRRR